MSAHWGKADFVQSPTVVAFWPLTDLGSSPCHTVVDLAAKRNKIDGLGQERLGSAFQGFSLGIRVAVGGDHDNGNVRSCCFGLRAEARRACAVAWRRIARQERGSGPTS